MMAEKTSHVVYITKNLVLLLGGTIRLDIDIDTGIR